MALFIPRFSPLMATPTPLVKIDYPGGLQSKTLIIFLPGIDDLAEDFEKRGVIDAMRLQGITADAVAIDAHFGYYSQQVILERITDDVIVWAHAAGYQQIWLAGISLGGFGAALYAAHHPLHIHGLLLFAPYLGDELLVKEIADAGGVRRWQPDQIQTASPQRALWAWFKQDLTTSIPALPVYLGYGTRDKFARAHALLAEILQPDHVFAIPGGHDWLTWKKIWQVFLQNWKQ